MRTRSKRIISKKVEPQSPSEELQDILSENVSKRNLRLGSPTPLGKRTVAKRSAVPPEIYTTPRKKHKSERQLQRRRSIDSESETDRASNAELIAEIAAVLEQARAEIVKQKVFELEDAENQVMSQLENIADSEGELLHDALLKMQRMFAPLLNHNLLLTDQENETFNISLEERLIDFKKVIREKKNKCQQLWTEWRETQKEITELGQAILGKDVFEYPEKPTGNGKDLEEFLELRSIDALLSLSSLEIDASDHRDAWKTPINRLLGTAAQTAIDTIKKAKEATEPKPLNMLTSKEMDEMVSVLRQKDLRNPQD